MRFAETPDAPALLVEPFWRGGVLYTAGWLASAYAQEPELLEAMGIGPVTEAAPPAEGQQVAAETLAFDAETGFYVDASYEPIPPRAKAALIAQVNADRDARIEGGFVFEGRPYQSRQSDRENIVRKGDRAQQDFDLDLVQPGQMCWDESLPEGQPFVFLAGDNSAVPMDAFTMVALRDAGEAFKQTCVFIARGAKDAIAAAADDATAEAIYAGIDWPPSSVE